MAATGLIALHIGKGKTAVNALQDRLDYSRNPDNAVTEFDQHSESMPEA